MMLVCIVMAYFVYDVLRAIVDKDAYATKISIIQLRRCDFMGSMKVTNALQIPLLGWSNYIFPNPDNKLHNPVLS